MATSRLPVKGRLSESRFGHQPGLGKPPSLSEGADLDFDSARSREGIDVATKRAPSEAKGNERGRKRGM